MERSLRRGNGLARIAVTLAAVLLFAVGSGGVDGAGRIYVADWGNGRIVRLDDMGGAGWTTFGRLGSGVGQFMWPRGVFVDGRGRIYVVDTANSRIAQVNDMRGAG